MSPLRAQNALTSDPSSLSAERLAAVQGEDIQRLLGWQRAVPLQEERARLLREVSTRAVTEATASSARRVSFPGVILATQDRPQDTAHLPRRWAPGC